MRNLIVLLTILSAGLSAQPLNEILDLTFKNNSALRSFDYRSEAIKSKAGAAGIYPAPQMMFTINQIPWPDGNPLNEAYSQELSFSQMFMTGGKLGAMRSAELKGIPLAEAQKREYKAKIASEITQSYFNLWAMDRELELQNRYNALVTRLINLISTQSSSGYRAAELISLKSEFAVSLITINKMKAERRSMELMLLGQTGISDSLLSAVVPILQPSDTLLTIGMDANSKLNPQLYVMSAMEEMLSAEKEAVSRGMYPDLMAELMFMRMPLGMPLTTKTDPEMIHDLGKGETEYMYGLRFSLTLPFLPGYSAKIKHNADEKALQRSALALERENMRKMFDRESAALREEFFATVNLMQSYKTDVLPLLRQNIQLLETLFSSGQAELSSLLREEKMYIMNEMEMLGLIKKMLSIKAKYIPYTDFEQLSQEGQL
ncbi:MAG: TolC family protein [Ignavibacteriaceae bacterium]|nr:TolC family protein [Ignavibacteriaceae bacterium]